MKLIRNILLIATGLSMASCNYLDVNTDTKDRMSLEEVFTDETYTEQWLANAYSYLTNSEFADISITAQIRLISVMIYIIPFTKALKK